MDSIYNNPFSRILFFIELPSSDFFDNTAPIMVMLKHVKAMEIPPKFKVVSFETKQCN